jgi:hypothetical protein
MRLTEKLIGRLLQHFQASSMYGLRAEKIAGFIFERCISQVLPLKYLSTGSTSLLP